MRLWSLNPCLLDAKGLVALWREGLLARAVLSGRTRGYRHHPQLARFAAQPSPIAALDAYLSVVAATAQGRGYHFNKGKLGPIEPGMVGQVSAGQLRFELLHLREKLRRRAPDRLAGVPEEPRPDLLHPLFLLVPGQGCAVWEKGQRGDNL